MEMYTCGECSKLVLQPNYWLPDRTVVFCNAECSFNYHRNKGLINERVVDREVSPPHNK